MRLYEFTEDPNTLSTKLTGIVSQIHGRMGDTGSEEPYSLKALLNILGNRGIHVTDEQFRSMVGQPPLNNLIANVQGDRVIFKGHEGSDLGSSVEEPDDTTDTLKKMASRAEKKRD